MTLAWPILSGILTPNRTGWNTRRIGDLVELINGYPFDSAAFGPTGDMPLVRIRDLDRQAFETYVSGQVPERVVLRNDDVVIGMDGDFNVVRWHQGPAALNQRLCILRPKPGVDIRFVYYWLPAILRILNDLAFSTTVKHLASGEILAERIRMPPLDEQRRIADFLDNQVTLLDRAISLRRQQIELLKERAFSEVSFILARPANGAGHREFPWLADTGKSLVKLAYVCDLQGGVTVDAAREGTLEFPYLRVANVQDGSIDLAEVKTMRVTEDLADRARLYAGDVLVTEGGDLDKLGRGALWQGQIADCLHQNHIFALRPHKKVLMPEYLAALTRTHHARRYFEITGNRTTNLASTNSSKILAFRFEMPSVPEQALRLRRVDQSGAATKQAISLMTRQVNLLRERKQSLITAAVTGEFDVATARRVTADV